MIGEKINLPPGRPSNTFENGYILSVFRPEVLRANINCMVKKWIVNGVRKMFEIDSQEDLRPS